MSISSFLILYYPTHAGSEDLKPLKPAFDNDNFWTIRQSLDFSLPLKETIVDSKNPIVQKSLRDLIARADSYLSLEPDSVVGKSRLPPSGDKHDFLSLAPFHWPETPSRVKFHIFIAMVKLIPRHTQFQIEEIWPR